MHGLQSTLNELCSLHVHRINSILSHTHMHFLWLQLFRYYGHNLHFLNFMENIIYWSVIFFLYRCNHWRACIVQSYSSYYLDYYFSVPGWKTTWQNSTVVRAVINGTRSARTHGGVPHDFYHVYDFFNFHPGPPDPSNFQLPGGYYCVGLKGENKTVPKVPSVFSVEYETVWSGNHSNQTLYVVSSWKVCGAIHNILY